MKGAWILPTRKRLDKLQRFLDAAVALGMKERGYILVNETELTDPLYSTIRLPENWVFIASPHTSICETVRGAINLYRDLDWVGTVTDDVVPETEGWEQKLISLFDGRTIISCDDGGQAPRRMAGAIVWPVALFKAVGYWVPNGFRHCFVDDVWETLGRECGCWRVNMDVMVRHLHPWVTGQSDDTHQHSYRADKWANDSALYEQWKVGHKDQAIAKLKEFLSPYHELKMVGVA